MKSKKFDKAFKEHAVNLWIGSGKSAREIAVELGIKPDRLYVWKDVLGWALRPLGGKGAQSPSAVGPRNWRPNWRGSSVRINTCASNGTF